MRDQIFHAGAMARINGQLKPAEAVFYQIRPKTIRLAHVGFRKNRQVEKHEEPHDAIGIKALHSEADPADQVSARRRKKF